MERAAAYDRSLQYLFGLGNREADPVGMGALRAADPERMRRLLELLEEPQRAAPILMIAGTKGKGSTAAFASAILHAAGLAVGTYTQPSLHTFRERLQFNAQPVTEAEVVDLTDGIRTAISKLAAEGSPPPTTYEATTAMMFDCFARREADVLVVEVGIGGRLDAVNIADAKVAAITPISYDHMDVLGSTLELIAWEKAGIIKQDSATCCAPQPAEASEVIRRRAREMQSELWQVRQVVDPAWRDGVAFTSLGGDLAGQWLSVRTPTASFPKLHMGLLGQFQQENAATAIGSVLQLGLLDVDLAGKAVEDGVSATRWPGRLEIVHDRPTVVVDGAHNAASIAALVEALKALFPDRPLAFVLGSSKDKDLTRIVSGLLSASRELIVTRSSQPRSAPTETLLEIAAQLGTAARTADSTASALDLAMREHGAEHVICVTGSLYVVAEAREFFGLGTPDRVRW